MNINQIGSNEYLANEDRVKDRYPDFSKSIRGYFKFVLSEGDKLFTTNAKGLFEAYLDNLPEVGRQHYNCNTCKDFINRYGGLVTINKNGEIKSAIWNEVDVPEFFATSVKAMKNIVLKSRVNGVFISESKVLGESVKGDWDHMSVELPNEIIHQSKLINASQAMAEKLEDYRILISALLEYPVEAVEQAVTLLKTESLYRSEKCLGVAEWLKEIHTIRSISKNSRNGENFIWLSVATAPNGYCHIKSSMIGSLLDDIVSGLPFEVVSRKFSDKMHPLKYQRPQAPPTAGNIAQAEKIVERLGIQKSLVRRFAKLDELQNLWMPKGESVSIKSQGIFSHLKTKVKDEVSKMEMPETTMTWRKFSETILPVAEKIEYFVKGRKENFSAILTAAHEEAPPILQWDSEEKRNPFSWYIYHGGSEPKRWKLSKGYVKVTGVCLQPSMWYKEFPNQSKSVFFILEGAKDSLYENTGNSLFPEMLKSELREIRSTIEAYSKSAKTEGYDNASACGIKLEYASTWDAKFRVTTNTGIGTYKLDRWD